jgi:hypothetical protein
MTKKDLVALADSLRMHNRRADGRTEFTPDHLRVLADFCAAQYPNFNRERWIDYIAGVVGSSDELTFVEPDSTVIPAIVEGTEKPFVSRVKRDERSFDSGKKRP